MFGTAVVALGGNALTREGEAGTYEEMAANARAMAEAAFGLHQAGWRVVITHGNGPQVGNLAIQQECELVPAQPLCALGAMTQGLLGSLFCLAWRQVAGKRAPEVVSVVTHMRVDADDPAFGRPTKPIGPFFSAEKARTLAGEKDWEFIEDSGRGYRRVVASPTPLEIVEAPVIEHLVDEGYVVVATGGGGIPVVDHGPSLAGVDAVVDKDLAAALLGSAIGARSLVLVTGVDAVMLDYGTPRERVLSTVTAEEMRGHLAAGQFPEGSMGPKVRAALQFLDGGGGCAVITSPGLVSRALSGRVGTRIVRGAAGQGAA
ncbi:MAG TPA: carbamate kinase [Mycobacteriales bacterium]|nr:carbamate kinase [Mycobacteriales bacterium]